jgi:hypothetical protein
MESINFFLGQGDHNVLQVNGTDFQQCVAPAGIELFTSGNDVITLATLGEKLYCTDRYGKFQNTLQLTILAGTLALLSTSL